jgi:hypothetical protein
VIRAAIVFTALTAIGLVVGMEIGGNGIDLAGLYLLAFAASLVGARSPPRWRC